MYCWPKGFLLCLFFSMSSLAFAKRVALTSLEVLLIADIENVLKSLLQDI